MLPVVLAVPPPDDDRVEPFWRRLGLPGLVDVHTHFLPDRMLRRVWAHFDSTGPLIGQAWPITYRWSHDDRLAYLPRLGVRAFTALSYAHRPGMAADLTDWSLALAGEAPGCVPSATFFPEDGVAASVRDAIERGAKVFKLHAQVGGFDLREPVLDDVWGCSPTRAPGRGPHRQRAGAPRGSDRAPRRSPGCCAATRA